MQAAVYKLTQMGHKRIAYVGHSNARDYSRRYREGFHAAMAMYLGVVVPPSWDLVTFETHQSALNIEQQFEEWLNLPELQRPTAIVAVSQTSTPIATIEQTLLKHGIKVGDLPSQFGIAGSHLGLGQDLLKGRAWIYSGVNNALLIGQMVRHQLIPLAQGNRPENMQLRYLPILEQSGLPILRDDMSRRMGLFT